MKRTRKEQKRDSQKHFDCLEKFQDRKAQDAFRRPAYQAGKMVQEQGRQIEHKTVPEYLAEKYDIKERVSAGGQEDTEKVRME